LGVSGISGDVCDPIGNPDIRAREVVDLFSYRAAFEIGGLTSALGGLDGIVFTAGIGESVSPIRSEICKRLSWLGARLDESTNANHAPLVSVVNSNLEIRFIATDEAMMIARRVEALLSLGAR